LHPLHRTDLPTHATPPPPHLHPTHRYQQHGPGAVLGYSCLLTGAPEDWYTPRGKRRALLRLEAQTESWVLQIPHAFVDQAIKHNPFPTLALAARKVRWEGGRGLVF
jgi:hypothetical protein